MERGGKGWGWGDLLRSVRDLFPLLGNHTKRCMSKRHSCKQLFIRISFAYCTAGLSSCFYIDHEYARKPFHDPQLDRTHVPNL